MALHQTAAQSSYEPMMTQFTNVFVRHHDCTVLRYIRTTNCDTGWDLAEVARNFVLRKISGVHGLWMTSCVYCYTVLAWWHQDCRWAMKHGITLFDWLVYNMLALPQPQWIVPLLTWPMGISTVSRGHWQSLCTALTAGNCLPLGLCKETVNGFISCVAWFAWNPRGPVLDQWY